MKKTAFSLLGALLFGSSTFAASAELKPVSLEAMDWKIHQSKLIYWRWVNNTMSNFSGTDYAVNMTTPYSVTFDAEVCITPRENRSIARSEAALALVARENKAAFRFALVEKDKKRFADLKLYFRNNEAGAKQFKTEAVAGKNFQWEYNKTYRMLLQTRPGSVTGKIFLGKKLVCELKADTSALKLPAMTYAFYTTALSSEFSAPKAAWGKTAPVPAPRKTVMRKPVYKSPANVLKSYSSHATGYFRVEQDKTGRWHFIDPLGKAFFACGVDRLYMGGRFCEALGYSPYLRNMQRTFKTRYNWEQHTMKRLQSWGFNYASTTTGGFYLMLPYSTNLQVGSTFSSFGEEYDICPYKGAVGSALPNPFHPRFEEWAKRCYDDWAAPDVENPYFLGYFCDNELRWRGMNFSEDGSGVFDTVVEYKKPSHLARVALKKMLKERFGNDIAKFNAFWKTSFKSFDDFDKCKKLPHTNKEQLEMKLDYLRLVAETYFSRLRRALKEADPNHLFLGNRYAGIGSVPDPVWEITGKYCDVVSFNEYPTGDREQNKLYNGHKELVSDFKRVAALCKRPMLITEWSVLGLDSGLPCQVGAGQRLRTQTERTWVAEHFLRTMLSLPFMVGISWYQYSDDPKLGVRKSHPENCNFGLVSEEDKPYQELTSMFARLQKDLDATRSEGVKPPLPTTAYGELYNAFNSPVLPENAKTNLVWERKGRKMRASNGKVTLSYSDKGGALDFAVDGEKIGKFIVRTMSLYDGEKRAWPHSRDFKDFKAVKRTGGLEIRFTSIHRDPRIGAMEMTNRILIPTKGDYYIAEITGAKNTGKKFFSIWNYIFETPPAFEPVIKHNYPDRWLLYCKDFLWENNDGMVYGAVATLSRWQFHFFRPKKGELRSNGTGHVRYPLNPGESYKEPNPFYAIYFGGKNIDAQKRINELRKADMAKIYGIR